MEPNVVKNDGENSNNTNGENNNFKLKGPRGWLHSLKNKVEDVSKNATSLAKSKRKVFLKAVLAVAVAILKVLLPVVLILCCFWWHLTEYPFTEMETSISSYVSSSSSISTQAKTTYEKNGTTLYFTKDDVKGISAKYGDSMKDTAPREYEALYKDGMIGSHKISEVPYAEGFDINNASEFILNSEKMNFNRITWKKYDRATGTLIDLETQTDSETNLKYPKNDEDTNKDLDYFRNMLMPYTQSHNIALAMFSGISPNVDAEEFLNFAFQIIDKGYHIIDVVAYSIQSATRNQVIKHYISKEYDIKKYQRMVSVTVRDENGNEVATEVIQYGYKLSELEAVKEQAKEDYNNAKEAKTELTEIESTTDASVNKNIVYAVTKAYTLKKHMSAEYEFIAYSDDDVNNLRNAKYEMNVKSEKFSDLQLILDENDEGGGYFYNVDDTWVDTGETIKVSVQEGEHVTRTYLWNDELKEKELEERFYTVDDVAEFVSEMDTTGTQDSENSETESDVSIEAADLFNQTETGYYTSLEKDDDITRIDLINAVPSIYNDYLYNGQNYSEYIGYNREYLTASYSLLRKSLPDDELTISYGKLLNQALGMNYLVGLSIGEGFMWPLPLDGSNGQSITECAGGRINPTSGKYQKYHGAMDIGAYDSTHIFAAQKGTVYEVSVGPSYGNFVVLKHDFGGDYVFYTRYAHMNSNSATNVLNLKVGQEVEAGQVIGFVGTTGNSTGNHLHFEIYRYPRERSFDGTDNMTIRLEPLFFIKRETVPQRILTQKLEWDSCSDVSTEDFGTAIISSEEDSSSDSTSSTTNTQESTSGTQ